MHAPRRILVPVTLATDSARIVAVAGALAAPLDAELILLGVAPFPQTLRPAAQVEDAAWLATDAQQHLLDQLIWERLEELTGALPRQVQVRTMLTSQRRPGARRARAGPQGATALVRPSDRLRRS